MNKAIIAIMALLFVFSVPAAAGDFWSFLGSYVANCNIAWGYNYGPAAISGQAFSSQFQLIDSDGDVYMFGTSLDQISGTFAHDMYVEFFAPLFWISGFKTGIDVHLQKSPELYRPSIFIMSAGLHFEVAFGAFSVCGTAGISLASMYLGVGFVTAATAGDTGFTLDGITYPVDSPVTLYGYSRNVGLSFDIAVKYHLYDYVFIMAGFVYKGATVIDSYYYTVASLAVQAPAGSTPAPITIGESVNFYVGIGLGI